MLRIDVAFKQTRPTLELDMAAGDQTLELTFDDLQRVDGAADLLTTAHTSVTPLITAQRLANPKAEDDARRCAHRDDPDAGDPERHWRRNFLSFGRLALAYWLKFSMAATC